MADGTVLAVPNPLRCLEIDLLPQGATIEAERLLEFLSSEGGKRGIAPFVERYRELSSVVDALPVAPTDATVLRKLVWPLRSAVGSYALGNNLSCIAMCGMVGEMLAQLLWDISRVSISRQPKGAVDMDRLLGQPFERLAQKRRVEVLQAFQLIDAPEKANFDRLRELRNKYLHLLSHPHEREDEDARTTLEAAAALVRFVLGLSIHDGRLSLRPELMAYLVACGVAHAGDSPNGKAV